ncbi:hypothetical protein [Leuconostoc mesenteroides]|uniref:hypothetical protein n=1 Tax=Leuconostoc mesenteroides TaxID=1245 RepID=UPI00236161C0|nr:hypothetical protein [Leuconostoc mesenteroides]
MKFTEAHFNKLVMLQEKEYPNNVYSSSRNNYNNIDEALKKYDLELYRFVEDNDLENQVVALMNLETREWAHDKFVEKEKKYFWKLNGLYLIKDIYDGSIIFDRHKKLFTESEIKVWGYNPEMFDREEVQ